VSQPNVERVIGQLVTDEAFRSRFTQDPRTTLRQLSERGFELTPCELQALVSLDPRVIARLAGAIDPRLQKTDLRGISGGSLS
jgi:hypothetical protein